MDYKDSAWQDSMRIRLDYTNMTADAIGEEHGITDKQLDDLQPITDEIHRQLTERRKAGELAFMDLPYQSKESLSKIIELSKYVRGKFDNFILVGIGGSALGPQALHQALNHPYYNLLSKQGRNGSPRIFFTDNVDAGKLKGLLDIISWDKTAINVITKSGSTAETMSNFLILRKALIDAVGEENYAKHIIATTDPKKGALRQIAVSQGYAALDIPPGVGGRFSVFTPVGLLSAAVCGIDIRQLLAGAAYMDKLCQSGKLRDNPAYLNAALLYLADTAKNKRICVMMPYSSSLQYSAFWFAQLWAESLGKKYSVSGDVVNVGQTPVGAVGATDQHSQLQLYIEGPFDKVITFIRVQDSGYNIPIPLAFLQQEGISYLGGHDLGELLLAEQTATALALKSNKRPNCTISIPKLNAFTMGQLLYMLQVQTAFAGSLYGINAFDQPGVEQGKQATYALMGRIGYEDKKLEIEDKLAKQNKWAV